jgi:protein SCO1
MRSLLIICFTCLLIASGPIGCSNKTQNTASPEVLKEFTVKGVLIRIENEGRTLVIKHEEMPGYMGAMTMPFRLKDPVEAKGIAPGDEIEFTYKVAELSSWIETLSKTGNTEMIEAAPAKSDQSNLLKPGDAFPNFALLDEDGNAVNLVDYRGSIIALTFIFTRCPVPEYCPSMMRNFSEVDRLLKEDANAPESYKLLTVSFDSSFDTPDILKAYGQQFGQGSTHTWDLLSTPDSEQVRSLGESVGLMFGKSNNAIYTHNLRTVVLDAEGRITKIFTDETWKPARLVSEIKAADAGCCPEG